MITFEHITSYGVFILSNTALFFFLYVLGRSLVAFYFRRKKQFLDDVSALPPKKTKSEQN